MAEDEELARVAALLTVDRQPSEELPGIARDALTRGLDSPSLWALSGTSRSDVRDALDLFWAALDELGIDRPSPDQARWSLVVSWARDIGAGRVTPIDGARRIWWDAYEPLGRPEELTVFVGLASEWEDDEPRRGRYEQAIREAAAQVLARHA